MRSMGRLEPSPIAGHLPLFFTADNLQGQIPLLPFLLSTVVLSVVFAWLFNRSRRSVLPALVLRTAVNWWAWIVLGLPVAGSFWQFALLLGLFVLLAIGLLAGPTVVPGRAGLQTPCANGRNGSR